MVCSARARRRGIPVIVEFSHVSVNRSGNSQRCIPGCESLEKTAADTYAATLKAGVGAIKGTFKGEVRLEDMRPPEHYHNSRWKGVGFAKGSADFDLEKDGATVIKYSGELQIGGTIAGVGQRMIQGAAKMMASRFLASLEGRQSNIQS